MGSEGLLPLLQVPATCLYPLNGTNEWIDFWIMLFCAITTCRNVSEKYDRDSGFLRKAGSDCIAS